MSINVIRSQVEEKSYMPLIQSAKNGIHCNIYDKDLQTRRNSNSQYFAK